MNTTTLRKPIVPEDRHRLKPHPETVPRACWAAFQAAMRNANPVATCEKIFPDDPVALALLTRATVTGATVATPAWAGLLANRSIAEWLGSLYPTSAAAALIRAGTLLPLDELGLLSLPARATGPAPLPWIAEAAPIPLRQLTTTAVPLTPAKMGCLVVLTKELARSSAAEAIFQAELTAEASAALDAGYFSSDAGSVAGHHRGLLAGLVAITGSASMIDDLAKLAEAVGAGGSGQTLFVASPGRAAAAQVRMPAEATATVLPSLAIASDVVVAVDPVSLVHGYGLNPEIVSTETVLLNMADPALDIGTAGPVLASPSVSTFQTAQIAMRLVIDCAFAARRTGAVAMASGCTW